MKRQLVLLIIAPMVWDRDWRLTSGGSEQILDFFDESLDGGVHAIQLSLVGLNLLPKVRRIRETVGELQRQ
jgi:hypothetical protein